MIAWGYEDRITPVEQTRLWQHHIPQAQIRVFEGAGHLVHLENPKAVAAIEDFLA
jgi:pimeloyl-ACP methyl ester carboxylesterase